MKTLRLEPGIASDLKRLAITGGADSERRDYRYSIERDKDGKFYAVESVYKRYAPEAEIRRTARPMKEQLALQTLANHKRLSAIIRQSFAESRERSAE